MEIVLTRILAGLGEVNVDEAINNMPKTSPEVVLANIVELVFFLIGAGAVVTIIYAGFMMVTSTGNPGAVARARNTLVYAIVGLVVAILAVVIVNTIVDKL